MNKKAVLLILTCALLTFCACSKADNSPASFSGIYYDTIVSIDIYGAGSNKDAILDECAKMCEHYGKLFDKNLPGSDIYRINNSDGTTVSVDHDTALLISKALEYSEGSDGSFDISIAPVSALWDFHDNPRVPSEDEIISALGFVDHTKVSVDISKDTVTVPRGMALDPGGIAKGYIADRIGEYLLSCSITGAIINMGGDIKVIGTKPDKTPFKIGINDPFNEGNVLLSLSLSDKAVATSGIYERCFVANGRSYHHILDTSTGYPADTDIESVTVITDSATSADSLCTLAILYGSQKALHLLEDTKDTEAVILLTDNTLLQTSGAGRYIRQ